MESYTERLLKWLTLLLSLRRDKKSCKEMEMHSFTGWASSKEPFKSLSFRVTSLPLNASLTLLATALRGSLQMTVKGSIKTDSFFSSSNLYSLQKHCCSCGLFFMIAFMKVAKRQSIEVETQN